MGLTQVIEQVLCSRGSIDTSKEGKPQGEPDAEPESAAETGSAKYFQLATEHLDPNRPLIEIISFDQAQERATKPGCLFEDRQQFTVVHMPKTLRVSSHSLTKYSVSGLDSRSMETKADFENVK